MKKVAVIGAGISGAACAYQLVQRGFEVEVFEKSRGVGGRMVTRRTDSQPNIQNLNFDHGAPFFRGRSPVFLSAIEDWRQKNAVATWQCGDTEEHLRFVGVPGMNALCKDLLNDILLRTSAEVKALKKHGKKWNLTVKKNQNGSASMETVGPFDHVVMSIPAPQACDLLADHSSMLMGPLSNVTYAPCWAVLAHWTKKNSSANVYENFDAESPLSWMGKNSTKPGRSSSSSIADQSESWVIHASGPWSLKHLETAAEEVTQHLLRAAFPFISPKNRLPDFAVAHRWRYARVTRAVNDNYLTDEAEEISVCGDSLLGGRVESAYLSGLACGREILNR